MSGGGPTLLIALGAPAWLWLAAAAAPIVLLYLLKRRYRELPVSSTLLWSRVLEDVLARSSFRRPSEWLSLLLLVLAVLLIAGAAADLRFGAGGDARALVLVVDVTASMGTRGEDGEERIERAREGAREAIDGLRSGAAVMAIAAGAEARVAFHATTDRRLAREGIDRLSVEPAGGALGEALAFAAREARGLATAAGPARIVVLSDFAVAPDALVEVDVEGAPVVLVACGAPAANVGIVRAAVSGGDGAVGDGVARLLVGVAAGLGGGDGGRARTVSLFRDGALVGARTVEVEPGGEVAVAFEVAPPEDERGDARYRVTLEPPDAFPADDEAFVGVRASPPPRLLVVGPANPFVDRLADVFPGLEATRVAPGEGSAALEEGARAPSSPFVLALVTAAPPASTALPARRELWLGVVPDDVGLVAGREEDRKS
ncbi:MAG: VWA domain-containing protein, partial [Planctomycetota bacterium JB042]